MYDSAEVPTLILQAFEIIVRDEYQELTVIELGTEIVATFQPSFM